MTTVFIFQRQVQSVGGAVIFVPLVLAAAPPLPSGYPEALLGVYLPRPIYQR